MVLWQVLVGLFSGRAIDMTPSLLLLSYAAQMMRAGEGGLIWGCHFDIDNNHPDTDTTPHYRLYQYRQAPFWMKKDDLFLQGGSA